MKIDGIEHHPTPEELAEEWWGMSDHEQACFFNRLGRIRQEDPHAFDVQLCMTAQQGGLTLDARAVLQAFHEYSHEGDRV